MGRWGEDNWEDKWEDKTLIITEKKIKIKDNSRVGERRMTRKFNGSELVKEFQINYLFR